MSNISIIPVVLVGHGQSDIAGDVLVALFAYDCKWVASGNLTWLLKMAEHYVNVCQRAFP